MKEGLDSGLKGYNLPMSPKEIHLENKYKELMMEADALNLTVHVMEEYFRAASEFRTKHESNGVKYREEMAREIYERCSKVLSDSKPSNVFFDHKNKKLYKQQNLF